MKTRVKEILRTLNEIGEGAEDCMSLLQTSFLYHSLRLIEGLCIPFASSLYINMLDEIKNIGWHAREIATKLTAEMGGEVD